MGCIGVVTGPAAGNTAFSTWGYLGAVAAPGEVKVVFTALGADENPGDTAGATVLAVGGAGRAS